MLVTGYMLREAIRRWQLRRDTLATQFEDAFHFFEGEEKESPDDLAKAFMIAERAVAELQAAQARYNLQTTVTIDQGMASGISIKDHLNLCMAVKLIGGAGRIEKFWRTAAAPSSRDRYSCRDETVRNKDEIRAKKALSFRELTERATKATNYAGQLRAAIAEANSTKQDIDLDLALFE
jgi:hypothetical protein